METLEDVLAGPETEVMDAIQVATPTISTLLCLTCVLLTSSLYVTPPRDPFVFDVLFVKAGIDRYNLRATSSAQRVQKWTLLPTDFSIPGNTYRIFGEMKFFRSIFDQNLITRRRDGTNTEGEKASGDAEV